MYINYNQRTRVYSYRNYIYVTEISLQFSQQKWDARENSLPKSNEREHGNIIADADDKDEPQGQGELLHIGYLDNFPLEKEGKKLSV